MTARTKKEWRCENCGSTTANDPGVGIGGWYYCPTCVALGECDVCDELTLGLDHSWHCDHCTGIAESDEYARSTSIPTLHIACEGEPERKAQYERERHERGLFLAKSWRKEYGRCAMLAKGVCGDDVLGPEFWDIGMHRQEDGRRLCRTHDWSENKDAREAKAEADRVYAALPKELYCSTCDKVVAPDEVDDESWYECECGGEAFTRDMSANDNHQCPYCAKFAKRSDSEHCADCREPLDVRPVVVTA
jgi:hypothetical protein